MIPRIQLAEIAQRLTKSKLFVLTAPKGLNPMGIMAQILTEKGVVFDQFSCANSNDKKRLSEVNPTQWNALFTAPFTILDETQFLPFDIQVIIDQILTNQLQTTLILTGTFLPQLDEYLIEALRMEGMYVHIGFPSFYEIAQHHSLPAEEQLISKRIIFGNSVDLHTQEDNLENGLIDAANQLFVTHLGRGERINKADQLMRVLRQLAFHIGEVVTYNQIATECELDNETVERYIDILVKAFWIIRLPSFSNGHRYELKKSHQFYFTDVGIRNGLIQNFNPMDIRIDQAALWKNWLIAERIKWNDLNLRKKEYFFWKTHTNQQIDLIEVDPFTGNTEAFKSLWDKRKKPKIPNSFTEAYPHIKTHVLNRATYWRFLAQKS